MRKIILPERPDWRSKAADVGFGFHEMYGQPYWTDGAAYAFSLSEIEDEIEDPSQQLHDMCMDLIADIIDDDRALAKLCIPESAYAAVRQSWHARDRSIYGRFDLAYTGEGQAKLLEYNADTPTSIFEAAYFQHEWLMDQVDARVLPPNTDQFNMLQEQLIAAFHQWPKGSLMHFACAAGHEEDLGTTTYLSDCAVQAGLATEIINIADIGVSSTGEFTDTSNRIIERCFKLYPWEDMLRDDFAKHLTSGVFVEPIWKSLLSNKGILPMLWQRNPGHPNLLPAYFADDPRAKVMDRAVTKPIFSREGENVTIRVHGITLEESSGDYQQHPSIVQQFAPLFQDGTSYAVLGSWIVNGKSSGLGMREDTTRITRDLSRFVPHIIEA